MWVEFSEFSQLSVHFLGIWLIWGIVFVDNKMMAEDLGVEAKEASVREVAKLLPLPELLQSIASIKADYIARQQVVFND